MSLTVDQQAQYVAAIAAIWPDMPRNTAGNISDEVAGYVDQALHAALFGGLAPESSWKDVLVHAAANGTGVGDWIFALKGQTTTQACISAVAVNWRPVVETALTGLGKEWAKDDRGVF